MTLSNPLSIAEFWDAIPMAQGRQFDPDEAMEVNRTGGGTILASDLGQRLWRGQITFGLASDLERRQAEAVLSRIRQAGWPFFCYDRKRTHPAADPDGAILGASVVTIHTADAGDLGIVRLQGLPAGYVLTAGDLIGWSAGSEPEIHYVHQLAETVVADAGGVTPDISITPFRPFGFDAGTPVTLIRPLLTAVYDPGSFNAGQGLSGGWERGRAFRFIQTLEY